MKSVNLAIIGAGMIGDVHIKTARADGRAEVSWIAARTQQTLNTKLKAHNIPSGTLDYQDILADSAVDAVVIASPPHTHAEMTLAALDAGKHVLLEKPMATRQEDVDAILHAVQQHPQQIVLECSCRHARLQPKFRLVKQLIDDGKLGDVYHIHHNHLTRGTFIEYNPAGAWALDKEQAGGGPFMDWGVYDLSFHLGVLNDKPQLREMQSFTRGDLKVFQDSSIQQNVEEHGAAYMQFDNGLTYYYERGSGVPNESANETRIHGAKGSLRFGFCSWDAPEMDYYFVDESGNEKQETLQVNMSLHSDDNLELMRHFLDCVLEGAAPAMTVNLAAKHLQILFQILQ